MKKCLVIAIVFFTLILLISCTDGNEDSASLDNIVSSVNSTQIISCNEDSSEVSLDSKDESSEFSEIIESSYNEELSLDGEGSSQMESSDSFENSDVHYKEYLGFEYYGFEENDLTSVIIKLKEVLDNSPSEFSVYYKNINTGEIFNYQGNTLYRNASVIKAPYVKYILSQNIDLEQKLIMSESKIQNGAGVINKQPIGTEFTIKDLIKYSIINSDNTAYKMLYDYFGFNGFNNYTKSYGINTKTSAADFLGYMNVKECGTLFEDIYYYMNNNSNGNVLYEYLTNTTYNKLIPAGINDVKIAHKYGYMSGYTTVIHDAGIVYEENPYILIIYSKYDVEKGSREQDFAAISKIINEFHKK
ncbi:class A beta-lactamase-related serine hydrolase [Eubacteriales bacterium OttesenSCG-928-G02]|nr:class A beta-lactamase-related serine hydrolase [Eubacteriales bacterium OttesenSCG-928-G02]